MLSTTESHEVLRKLLDRRRIATMDVFFEALGTPSRMTVFRRLRELGYRTSFSHRGRYYTLEDIPRFDAQGLWFWEGVGFSRFGTLKETVAELVPRAPAGHTHGELAGLLRVRVHNPLLDLVRAGRIAREAVEGLGEFLYVSAEPAKGDEQVARRLERLRETERPPLPGTETVLVILSEALRVGGVEVDPKVVARRLGARRPPVSPEEVERVFEHYLGKKNRRSPPSSSS